MGIDAAPGPFRTIALILGLGAAVPAASAALTAWGVNGHPFTQAAYFDVPLDQQLDLVADTGARWYRFDLGSDAFAAETARLDELLAKATVRKVALLPVLAVSHGARDEHVSLAEVQARGFAFGKAVAGRYQGRITHWELENELDIVAMIRRGETNRRGEVWRWDSPDGAAPEDYEDGRYARARAEILGLSEGVKAGDPRAQTIVDTAGWLHTGFIERLVREDHVPFDILAWHWYSEMGDITAVPGAGDLVSKLQHFGKPLWITETSRREGSADGHEQELARYLGGAVARLARNPALQGIFVYELLDEPYLGSESRYGLVEVARTEQGQWAVARKKAAYAALQSTINQAR